jgi:hypothetical protein
MGGKNSAGPNKAPWRVVELHKNELHPPKFCPADSPGFRFGGWNSVVKQPVESDFEIIPSDGAVEVIFIPTSCHYIFRRIANRHDVAEFGLLSPDPRVRHAERGHTTGNYTAPQIRGMAFRLASAAARRGWSGMTPVSRDER